MFFHGSGIPPGQNFVYNFSVAEQVGSFWFHSRVKGQVFVRRLLYAILIHHINTTIRLFSQYQTGYPPATSDLTGSTTRQCRAHPEIFVPDNPNGVEPIPDGTQGIVSYL